MTISGMFFFVIYLHHWTLKVKFSSLLKSPLATIRINTWADLKFFRKCVAFYMEQMKLIVDSPDHHTDIGG